MEASFQNMVDHEYSGKDRAPNDYPNGLFGITPGSTPPRWTLNQLAHELMGEYVTMPLNKRAEWSNTATEILGIIQQTVNNYADVLGQISAKTYSNTTPEWDLWITENKAA